MKVTVIATGFPGGLATKADSLFTLGSKDEKKEEPKEEKKKDDKPQGKIYNTLTGVGAKKEEKKLEEKAPEPAIAATQTDKKDEPLPKDIDEDDDDWGSVPAFLRRSKLK